MTSAQMLSRETALRRILPCVTVIRIRDLNCFMPHQSGPVYTNVTRSQAATTALISSDPENSTVPPSVLVKKRIRMPGRFESVRCR
jgi:hypothetical protein